MRQVSDRTFGPAKRFDLHAVHGERRPGGRDETVHVRRCNFQIQNSRKGFIDVHPLVGPAGRWRLVHDDRCLAAIRLRRRLLPVGRGQLLHE